MSYIVENMTQYDLSEDDVAKLLGMGLICKSEKYTDLYETTGIVWNDLGLEGETAYILFDAILGRDTDA